MSFSGTGNWSAFQSCLCVGLDSFSVRIMKGVLKRPLRGLLLKRRAFNIYTGITITYSKKNIGLRLKLPFYIALIHSPSGPKRRVEVWVS